MSRVGGQSRTNWPEQSTTTLLTDSSNMVALKSFTCLSQRNVQALHNWYKTTHLTNKTLWWIDHKPCVCPVRRHLKEIRLLPQGWSKNSYFYSLGGLFLWDSWRLFSSSSLQHKVVVLSNDQSLNGPQSLPTPPGLSCQYYMQESGEAVVTVTRTHAKPTRSYSIWLTLTFCRFSLTTWRNKIN